MGALRILSQGTMLLRSRREAGRLLAGALQAYRQSEPVVVGIPRGGVVVADEIARQLQAEMDILLSRKLRTPGYEELAMGSLAEDGQLFLNQELLRDLDVSPEFVQRENDFQMAEIKRCSTVYRRELRRVSLVGRVVIVTDDGVATGATIRAALWAIRMEKPSRLIAAYPVGPEETIRKLADDADETVCLLAPPDFSSVGQFYASFEPVEDEEVLVILKRQASRQA